MKKRGKSLICSITLAFVLFATMSIGTLNGSPLTIYAESKPDKVGSAEPTFAGYRIKDIKNWDREVDPYAEYLRATVPLKERNEAFSATQANPELSAAAQVMLMQSDYGNGFFNTTMYTDEFSMLTMNFWQYVDFFCPWHGAATAYTPIGLYDLKQSYEFGIVNIPNPAYTNAAHKNGVRSIACIYLDPNFRPGQTIRDLTWDGVADKLIEMAEYYGYDGYFLNNEESIDQSMTRSLIIMMKKLTDHGLWTQYYNTSYGPGLRDALNSFNSVFSQYSTHSSASSDKEWVNSQNWAAKGENYEGDFNDKYFYGMECNQARFSQNHTSTSYNALTNLKNANASVALFEPSTFYQRGLDSVITQYLDEGRPASQTDAYQWIIEERERIFFSGGNQDPSDTGIVTKNNSEVLDKGDRVTWKGVADMIAERSVINGSAFYTNFNTGHGMQYFKDGKVSSDHEWTNVNIQDIMPTWQWWVEGEKRPNVSYDYGSALTSRTISGAVKNYDYAPVGGYTGGNSLVVYGDIQDSLVHLYKTNLTLSQDSTAEISYLKSSDDGVTMSLDLIFENGQHESVAISGSGSKSSAWQTEKLDLSKFASSTYGNLAAINLKFEGTASGYQMNVGGITVTDGKRTPAAPTGFKIRNAYSDGQITVSWDEADDMAANYDDVVQYNLYAVTDSGERRFLGGIYGSLLYAKVQNAVESLSEVKGFELCAVGTDGSESAPSEIPFDYDDKVSNIQVDETVFNEIVKRASAPDEISVSWTAPQSGAPDRYLLEVTLCDVKSDSELGRRVFRAGAPGSATSATVPLPLGGEGYKYDLKIYAIKNGVMGEGTCYRGLTNDSYAQPISPSDIVPDGQQLRIVDPDTVDWHRMQVFVDDEQKAEFLRGTNTNSTTKSMLIVTLDNAQKRSCKVKVTLFDYAGNSSDTEVEIEDGKVAATSGAVSASEFRDPELLRVVTEQVGTKLTDLSRFKGTLDLSGTDISDLTGISLLENMSGVSFKNCTKLKSVVLQNKQLNYIDISGCSALNELDVKGLNLEKLDAEGRFDALAFVDVSDNKLDLSVGTPERNFIDGLIKVSTVKFTGQKPTAYVDLSKVKNVKKASASESFDVLSLVQAVTVTARGNDFASLKESATIDGLSSLADGYDVSAIQSSVTVSIQDQQNGAALNGSNIDLSKEGKYQVTFVSGDQRAEITLTVGGSEGGVPMGLIIGIVAAVVVVLGAAAAGICIVIKRKKKSE